MIGNLYFILTVLAKQPYLHFIMEVLRVDYSHLDLKQKKAHASDRYREIYLFWLSGIVLVFITFIHSMGKATVHSIFLKVWKCK